MTPEQQRIIQLEAENKELRNLVQASSIVWNKNNLSIFADLPERRSWWKRFLARLKYYRL